MEQTLTDLGTVFTNLITWFGRVISALFSSGGSWHSMLAFVFIGCAISIILTGVHVIKSLTFGRG